MESIEEKLRDKRREIKLLRLDMAGNQNLSLTGLSQSLIKKDKEVINNLSKQIISLKDEKDKVKKP